MERGRKEEGEDFLSGNTRASSSNPRIYATLAGILRDCKDEGERERGWLKRKKEGKEEIPSTMIYSTVFLTSITWPNNCRFIEDLLKKKNDWMICLVVLVCCLIEMVFRLDCLLREWERCCSVGWLNGWEMGMKWCGWNDLLYHCSLYIFFMTNDLEIK